LNARWNCYADRAEDGGGRARKVAPQWEPLPLAFHHGVLQSLQVAKQLCANQKVLAAENRLQLPGAVGNGLPDGRRDSESD